MTSGTVAVDLTNLLVFDTLKLAIDLSGSWTVTGSMNFITDRRHWQPRGRWLAVLHCTVREAQLEHRLDAQLQQSSDLGMHSSVNDRRSYHCHEHDEF